MYLSISQAELVPSYAFPIRYPAGGFVEWHIDQKDTELSNPSPSPNPSPNTSPNPSPSPNPNPKKIKN